MLELENPEKIIFIFFFGVEKMVKIKYEICGVKHRFVSDNSIKNIGKIDNELFLKLLTILKEWIRLSEKHKVEWWACSGTLLGAVRHKGFIPWDNDIDIAVNIKYYNKILNMKSDIVNINVGTPGFRISLKNDSAFPFIDVFMSEFVDNKSIFCGPIINNTPFYLENLIFPKEHFKREELYPLKKVIFENVNIYIPNDPIKYLHRTYGENCLTHIVIQDKAEHENKILLNVDNILNKNLGSVLNNIDNKSIIFDFLSHECRENENLKFLMSKL